MFARTPKKMSREWNKDLVNKVRRQLFPPDKEDERMAKFNDDQKASVRKISEWLNLTENMPTEIFLLVMEASDEMLIAAVKNVYDEPIAMSTTVYVQISNGAELCYYCVNHHEFSKPIKMDRSESCSYERACEILRGTKLLSYCENCKTNLFHFINYIQKRDRCYSAFDTGE